MAWEKNQHLKLEVWFLPSAYHFLNIISVKLENSKSNDLNCFITYLFVCLFVYCMCIGSVGTLGRLEVRAHEAGNHSAVSS